MLTIKRKHFIYAAHSDKGDYRAENEDSIFAQSAEFAKHDVGLFAVADGCGGMNCGAEASRKAVEILENFWDEDVSNIGEKFHISESYITEKLEEVMQRAHESVCILSREIEAQSASTLTLLMTVDNHFWIRHVGDSRVYRVRDGIMERLTEDQTVLADMLRNNEIDQSEARRYNRSLLSMSLGVEGRMYTYGKAGKIQRNDIFCICSDGLYAYMEEDDLSEILQNEPHNTELLRDSIKKGSARDNVSFVVVWRE